MFRPLRQLALTGNRRVDPGTVDARRARFDEVWRLRSRVAAFLRRQALDRETGDDLLSEIFLVAWRRLSEVPEGDDAATAWLCGVARHVVLNQRRQRRRQAALAARVAGHQLVEHHLEPDPAVVDEQRHAVGELWGSLRDSDRYVLSLSLHGLGLNELADVLGVSRGTAAVRLSRARSRLEKGLQV